MAVLRGASGDADVGGDVGGNEGVDCDYNPPFCRSL